MKYKVKATGYGANLYSEQFEFEMGSNYDIDDEVENERVYIQAVGRAKRNWGTDSVHIRSVEKI